MGSNNDHTNDHTIVRFMDLAKFLSLLTSKKLYFCGLDRLKHDDPYEGEINQNDVNLIIQGFLSRKEFDLTPNNKLELRNGIIEVEQNMRASVLQSVVVNCWHLLDNNSPEFAMWKLYSNIEYGVAIRSKVSNLSKAINFDKRPHQIEKVSYKDYSIEHTILGTHHIFEFLFRTYIYYVDNVRLNGYDNETVKKWAKHFTSTALKFYEQPIYSKRKSFEHEKELRITSLILQEDTNLNNGEKVDYLEIPVDLNILIEDVFISPNAPAWFRKTIEETMDQLGLNKSVYISSLLTPPVYR